VRTAASGSRLSVMRAPTTLCLALLSLTPPLAAQAQKKWIPRDPAVECAGVQEPALCAELLAIVDRDQLVRFDAMAAPEDKTLAERVKKTDAENLARIEAILASRGWPGKALVGEKAVGAPWTVIQHADLATQKKHIEAMRKAADAGELNWGLVATTLDRIAVREGKPQLYGTQFREVNGEQVPFPIEDEAHVDERRAKVGLQPLAEYTVLLRQMFAKRAPQPTPTQKP